MCYKMPTEQRLALYRRQSALCVRGEAADFRIHHPELPEHDSRHLDCSCPIVAPGKLKLEEGRVLHRSTGSKEWGGARRIRDLWLTWGQSTEPIDPLKTRRIRKRGRRAFWHVRTDHTPESGLGRLGYVSFEEHSAARGADPPATPRRGLQCLESHSVRRTGLRHDLPKLREDHGRRQRPRHSSRRQVPFLIRPAEDRSFPATPATAGWPFCRGRSLVSAARIGPGRNGAIWAREPCAGHGSSHAPHILRKRFRR